MRVHTLTALLFLVSVLSAAAQTTRDIVVGDMTLHISNSWTAQVFHITDQLSDWSPYSHHQYIRWAKKRLHLTAEDSAVLSHKQLLAKGPAFHGVARQSHHPCTAGYWVASSRNMAAYTGVGTRSRAPSFTTSPVNSPASLLPPF